MSPSIFLDGAQNARIILGPSSIIVNVLLLQKIAILVHMLTIPHLSVYPVDPYIPLSLKLLVLRASIAILEQGLLHWV